ncbi:TonB-dependent receptor [Parahaliea maris]|uniref:TonB-dependent receptor n=1 Tax=Parahaliea maris TaxID=2716870 RepID=A0A5C8ZW78_9GAMM|nr:TonB-dependent receptor [Parahaliea maris]TXS91852.1 TonB-dependent receptor [Parahaliea maris]
MAFKNRKDVKIAMLLGSSSAMLAFQPGSASAQQLTSGQIEEVVVTAQKREENVQDVPIAITALSGQALDELGLDNAEQLGAQVPGLVATSFSGGGTVSLFSIRGVSQNDFGDHQEGPVAVYADGVYIPSTSAAGATMYDLARVEVLKGPQGTLFGRNATGGLIQLISNKPTEVTEGYVDLTVGSYNQFTVEGALSGALTDTLLGRISVFSDNADGYFKNPLTGNDGRERESHNARVQLRWMPSDRATIDFVGRYTDNPRQIQHAYDARPSTGAARGDAEFDWFGNPDQGSEPNKQSIAADGYLGKRADSYELTAAFDVGETATITSISAYGNVQKEYREVDGSAGWEGRISQYTLSSTVDQDQFSQELRLNASTDKLRFQTGVYYLLIDGDFSIDTDFPAFAGRALVDASQKTESWSVFGQLEYDITSSLTAIVGARWVTDEKEYSNDTRCAAPSINLTGEVLGEFYDDCVLYSSFDPADPLIVDFPGAFKDDRDDTMDTYTAKLNYQMTEDVLIYGGYSRGAKAGGYNIAGDGFTYLDELTFDPEELDAWELGVKSKFWDSKAQLNVAAFYYDYSNYQAFTFAGVTNLVENAQAEAQGGEIELVLTPSDGWYFSAGLAFLDTELSDVAASRDGSATYPSQDMVLSPNLSANWIAKKAWTFGNGGSLDIQVDGNYVDEQEYSANATGVTQGDAYTLWNARLAYYSSNDAWEASVYVRNLTDETYHAYAFDFVSFSGLAAEVFGPPRWYGAQVRYRF